MNSTTVWKEVAKVWGESLSGTELTRPDNSRVAASLHRRRDRDKRKLHGRVLHSIQSADWVHH